MTLGKIYDSSLSAWKVGRVVELLNIPSEGRNSPMEETTFALQSPVLSLFYYSLPLL
ncbi:hypothetical protein J6590_095869 [Homalodisca vitripennis]|nr:hypothetical protein J6590_095869 [Homalodisca vitripennis]